MRKLSILLILLVGLQVDAEAQNVGINGTGNTPDNSAGLDIDFTDKGLLIPRVSLVSNTDVVTIPSPATSLLVYNTATAGTPPLNVIPGYYFWDGSRWLPIGINSFASNFNPSKIVYVNGTDPNIATQFGTVTYYTVQYSTNSCIVNPAFVNTPGLTGNTQYLYVGATTCDLNGDGAEYSAWYYDGSQYQPLTGGIGSTEWNLANTNMDAGANKAAPIERSGPVSIIVLDTTFMDNAFGLRVVNYQKYKNPTTDHNYGFGSSVLPMEVVNGRTTYGIAGYFNAKMKIDASYNNPGYLMGVYSQAFRGYHIEDQGRLSQLNGVFSQVGHYGSNTTTPITDNVSAFRTSPYCQYGTITNYYDFYGGAIADLGNVSNYYGFYILGGTKINYLAGKLGIGVTNPSEKLEVIGSLKMVDGNEGIGKLMVSDANGKGIWTDASSVFSGAGADGTDDAWTNSAGNTVVTAGNVGIGTTTPTAKLHVTGHIRLNGSSTGNSNVIITAFNNVNGDRLGYIGDGSTTDNNIRIHSDSADVVLHGGPVSVNTSVFVKNSTGFLGVGTNTPTSKMEVNGTFALATANGGTNTSVVLLANGTFATPAAAASPGRVYIIRNTSAATNVTVNSIINYGATAAANFTLTPVIGSIMIISDGTNWYRIQ